MFSVPLTSPPRTIPDLAVTTLQPFWPHGSSCGDCSKCCRAGGYACPLLDESVGLCRGYNSFYWRYFNCGRFPSVTSEIDYYGCRKWVLESEAVFGDQPEADAGITTCDTEQVEDWHGTVGKGVVEDIHRRRGGAATRVDAEQDLDDNAEPPKLRQRAGAYPTGKGDQRCP